MKFHFGTSFFCSQEADREFYSRKILIYLLIQHFSKQTKIQIDKEKNIEYTSRFIQHRSNPWFFSYKHYFCY